MGEHLTLLSSFSLRALKPHEHQYTHALLMIVMQPFISGHCSSEHYRYIHYYRYVWWSTQIVHNAFLLRLDIKDFKLLQYVNAVQLTPQEDIIGCEWKWVYLFFGSICVLICLIIFQYYRKMRMSWVQVIACPGLWIVLMRICIMCLKSFFLSQLYDISYNFYGKIW